MLRVSWQDFEVNSALQRDTLERAMPLVQTSTADDWTDLINLADPADPGYLTIVPDSIVEGATPESCVELLALRPLLFGTAWTGPRLPAGGSPRLGGKDARPGERELVDRPKEATRTCRRRSAV
jgi:hypothetical protein